MTVQITIIGLGQIGASLGLALASQKENLLRVGHDKDFSIERAAQQKGVVDKTEHNLPRAVQNSDVVLLSLPVHQVRETLKYIAPDLKRGAVVVDTTPIKSEVAKWAAEILPEGCYYIGLIPTIGSAFIQEMGTGLDLAKADLFKNSIFLLDAPAGTSGDALQLVSGLVKFTGATVMISDIVESDGLMASTYLLPQLVSAALVNATVNQPGWLEAQKVAGRAYFAATSAFDTQDDPESLQMLSMHNRENVSRTLDSMIAALIDLRDDIEQGNSESIKARLQAAQRGHEDWLNDNASANWVEKKVEHLEPISLKERFLGSMLGKSSKDKK
jgi:prephenate dehydrogenase